MNNNKKKIFAIVAVALVVLLGGAAVYVARQLSSRQAVAPNAPTSKPAASCVEDCVPEDGRLKSCNPADTDQTADESYCHSSVTAWNGSRKACGGTVFCCNGSNWTTDLTACPVAPTATATVEPTATTTVAPTATTTIAPTTTVAPTPAAQGRFRVTVNGTAGDWMGGTVDATDKKIFTSGEYTVGPAGTYKFEAQVSTIP